MRRPQWVSLYSIRWLVYWHACWPVQHWVEDHWGARVEARLTGWLDWLDPASEATPPFAVRFERRDWWVGYYRGPNKHFVCPVPLVVFEWPRKHPEQDNI